MKKVCFLLSPALNEHVQYECQQGLRVGLPKIILFWRLKIFQPRNFKFIKGTTGILQT